MAKVYIHPPNSLILFDLVKRFGHTPLGLGEEVSKNVNRPEIDAPPMNITSDFPRKGLKYVAIEVPSGIRGRLALIGPLIEEAEAAIIVDDPEIGFGCTSCGRANEFLIYLVKQKGIPYIVVPYPYTEEEAKIMVSEIKKFLSSLY